MSEQSSGDLETFRRDIRAWLEAHCPPQMRQPKTGDDDTCWGGRHFKFQSPAQKAWMEAAAAKGYTVPRWPKAYGGAGLSPDEGKIYEEELAAIGARRPLESFGISMLGPALLSFGTEEQKLEHLPKIARGEIRWCQGYSEPNAGSDLASLQTRCEDKGDHWLVNGQKIWTSYADKADWIFCLVRTNPAAPKHLGISFILFDMETPGVSTRPITLISGRSPFCETFFDNVKVPKHQVVGTVDRGWDVAKHLLTHEREMIGSGGLGLFSARPVAEMLDEDAFMGMEELQDPILKAQAAQIELDQWALSLLVARYQDESAGGKGLGDRSAILKYAGTEFNKTRLEFLMRAAGSEALEWESERSHEGSLARDWLRSKANSIEGGTSEVMLDIIAKRVLELPHV